MPTTRHPDWEHTHVERARHAERDRCFAIAMNAAERHIGNDDARQTALDIARRISEGNES